MRLLTADLRAERRTLQERARAAERATGEARRDGVLPVAPVHRASPVASPL